MSRLFRRIPDGRPNGSIQGKSDVTPPVTSYAYGARNTPMHSSLAVPASTIRSNSGIVSRKPIRRGNEFFYSHGATSMPTESVLQPGAAGVWSSRFQTQNVALLTWQMNRSIFMAGYPRNLGFTFRAPKPNVNSATGGPTTAVQGPKPIFNKVQTVPRYTVTPLRYNTRSANG